MFDFSAPEFDVRLVNNKHPQTGQNTKEIEFVSVCNFDLKKIRWITEIKNKLNSNLKNRTEPIESIINFEQDDWYYFYVEDIEILLSKKNTQYLKLKLGDGISSIYVRVFQDSAKHVLKTLEKNNIFVAQFEKKNNFLNLKKGTIIKKVDL